MFIEPGHSVIDLAPPAHAVLSQNFRQQLENLGPAHRPTFNQADHDAHVLHQRLRPRALDRPGPGGAGWGCRGFKLGLTGRRGAAIGGGATLVQVAFEALPLNGLVVRDTAPGRLLPAMGLAATEGTAQIFTSDLALILAPGIARIGEKEDTAVPTSLPAPSQVRVGSEQRSQQPVILQNRLAHVCCAIPVPPKLEMRRDLYCKNPKLSLRMLTLL
jgi:hypothetical protein